MKAAIQVWFARLAQCGATRRGSALVSIKMLEDADHESLLMRSSALIALGEIALFRGHLDVEKVLPEIQRFAADPALAPFVEDAVDNIRASKLLQ